MKNDNIIEFLDLKNPYLHQKIADLCQFGPEIWLFNFQAAILDFGGHFEFGPMNMKKISYFNSLTLKTYKNVKIVHLHINWGQKNANFLSGGHLGRHLEYFENEATNSLPLTSSGFSMFQSTNVPNLALLSKSAQYFALTALLHVFRQHDWVGRLAGL